MFTDVCKLSGYNKVYLGPKGVRPLMGCLQVVGSITGRLILFLENWSKVTQDHWILNTVQGYKLELMKEPVQSVCLKGQFADPQGAEPPTQGKSKSALKWGSHRTIPNRSKIKVYSR